MTATRADADLLARLDRAADEEAAFKTALRMLERRPFAGRDLARRLTHRGHPSEAVGRALGRAEALGLVNDRAFAEHFVATRVARGRGPARLRRELAGLGVERSVIEEALGKEFSDPGAAQALAEKLARRRLAQLSDLTRQERKQRVLAFLARRGYSGEPIRRMVEGMLG